MSTLEEMAAQNDFKLKTMFVNGHDNSVLKLATIKPVVVSATKNETMYNSIKFVKVIDWPGGTNRFFVYRTSSRKDTLSELKNRINSL